MAESTKQKYIMVAEDDKYYANIFKLKLSKEGYRVAVVGDGAQVLALLKKEKPNLILLDLIMPVKDGFETLRELKADKSLEDVNVIVISNLGQKEDVEKAKKLGAIDYLVKANVSVQEMVEKVKKHFQ